MNHDLDKFPSVFDSSMLSMSACPRKFYWRHIRNLAPTTFNPHLNAGGAYAKALFVYRKALYEDGKSFDAARAAGFIALTRAYGPEDPPEKQTSKQWINMIYAFLFYTEYYHPDKDTFVPHRLSNGKCALEFSFTLPIQIEHPTTKEPLFFAGRADGIVQDQMANLYVLDDKTTGAMGPKWHEQWLMRGQFTGYLWAGREFGYDLVGALVRGVSIQKTENKHLQFPVLHPRWFVDRWHEEMQIQLRDLAARFVHKNWPCLGQLTNECASYGGCAYRPLCESSTPEQWTSQYTPIEWLPHANHENGD